MKAHIALHQVYGVDLNPTAVELAEISLWLDTMTSDLAAPWFGLHLRAGNSLIGATRSTYSEKQVLAKEHFKVPPKKHPLTGLRDHATDVGLDPLNRWTHPPLPAALARLGCCCRCKGAEEARAGKGQGPEGMDSPL